MTIIGEAIFWISCGVVLLCAIPVLFLIFILAITSLGDFLKNLDR